MARPNTTNNYPVFVCRGSCICETLEAAGFDVQYFAKHGISVGIGPHAETSHSGLPSIFCASRIKHDLPPQVVADLHASIKGAFSDPTAMTDLSSRSLHDAGSHAE